MGAAKGDRELLAINQISVGDIGATGADTGQEKALTFDSPTASPDDAAAPGSVVEEGQHLFGIVHVEAVTRFLNRLVDGIISFFRRQLQSREKSVQALTEKIEDVGGAVLPAADESIPIGWGRVGGAVATGSDA